ncbi:hypothetical protein [Phenylobacterium sp.]|uniref:hypothetical protein n=1 Tax=Phenylobacterium sp. TaxID=1871053 RepID=UPI0027369D74|nr:hypothetical protein [Phenylobacterium sp.]MDP3853200.1 hypothetical protein [Phenylobacterium sp.]
MSTEYSPFARPKFTAEDFAREDPATTFDTAPRVASETRSFASDDAPSAAMVDPDLARMDETTEQSSEEASMFAAAPLYGQGAKSAAKSAAKSSGRSIAPIAMIAIPAVVLLAGVAYFTLQPRAGLIAEEPATIAAAPMTPAPIVTAPAPTAPIAKASAPTVRASTPRRVASIRPAAAAPAAGAEDVSSWSRDASATLPTAPVPYAPSAQTAAPAPTIVPPIAAEPVPPAPTVTPEPLTPPMS